MGRPRKQPSSETKVLSMRLLFRRRPSGTNKRALWWILSMPIAVGSGYCPCLPAACPTALPCWYSDARNDFASRPKMRTPPPAAHRLAGRGSAHHQSGGSWRLMSSWFFSDVRRETRWSYLDGGYCPCLLRAPRWSTLRRLAGSTKFLTFKVDSNLSVQENSSWKVHC
jgi:hypothetical protein